MRGMATLPQVTRKKKREKVGRPPGDLG